MLYLAECRRLDSVSFKHIMIYIIVSLTRKTLNV
nr:MAG TPA: hypothetical protein [Caudoviricetes sp.]